MRLISRNESGRLRYCHQFRELMIDGVNVIDKTQNFSWLFFTSGISWHSIDFFVSSSQWNIHLIPYVSFSCWWSKSQKVSNVGSKWKWDCCDISCHTKMSHFISFLCNLIKWTMIAVEKKKTKKRSTELFICCRGI